MSGARAPGGTSPEHRRAQRVVDTFIDLAGALAGEVDLAGLHSFLTGRVVGLFGDAEASLLLVGDDTTLRVVASSSEEVRRLGLFDTPDAEGPCLDVCRSGVAIINESLGATFRWPHFAQKARASGFQVLHALPMRHDRDVIGVLVVFDRRAATLSPPCTAAVQALADIASFATFQHRALRRTTELADQLRKALQSRIVVEQAKGIISAQLGVDVARAFLVLREYSRNRNERVTDASRRVVARSLGVDEVVSGARAHRKSNRAIGAVFDDADA